MYWWDEKVAIKRRECNRYRRKCMGKKKKNNCEEEKKQKAEKEYKKARKTFRCQIWRNKRAAQNELLEDLERDPWGRPYRQVMNRIRSSISATETMDSEKLKETLNDLFQEDTGGKFRIMSPFLPPNEEEKRRA